MYILKYLFLKSRLVSRFFNVTIEGSIFAIENIAINCISARFDFFLLNINKKKSTRKSYYVLLKNHEISEAETLLQFIVSSNNNSQCGSNYWTAISSC